MLSTQRKMAQLPTKQRVYELYKEGYALRAIAKMLNLKYGWTRLAKLEIEKAQELAQPSVDKQPLTNP